MLTNKQVRDMLRKSIAIWRERWHGVPQPETPCPLCSEFIHARTKINECLGCPVKEFTGKRQCQGTPYFEAKASNFSRLHSAQEVIFLQEVDYHFFGPGSQARVNRILGRKR